MKLVDDYNDELSASALICQFPSSSAKEECECQKGVVFSAVAIELSGTSRIATQTITNRFSAHTMQREPNAIH